MVPESLFAALEKDGFLLRMARLGVLEKHHCRAALERYGFVPTAIEITRVFQSHANGLAYGRRRLRDQGVAAKGIELSLHKLRNIDASKSERVSSMDWARERLAKAGIYSPGSAKNSRGKVRHIGDQLTRLKSVAKQRTDAGAITKVLTDGTLILYKSRPQ